MLFIKFSSPFHKKSLESYKMFCENEQKHKFSLTIKINLKFFCEKGTVFFLSVSVIKLFLHCRVTFVWLGQKESFLHGSFFVKENLVHVIRKYSGTAAVSDQFPIHLLYFMWGCAFITGANLLIKLLEKRGTWYVFFQITAKLTNLTIYVLMTPPLRIFGFLYMGVIDPDFLKLLSSKISLLFLRETILAESLKY